MSLRALFRSLAGGPREQNSETVRLLAEVARKLEGIDARLARLEMLSKGGQSVYVGDGRILTKVSLRHWNIGYLIEADDRLLGPHLAINGYHEIDITEYFLNNISDHFHCLDVGANIGYFTCIMGRWAPKGKTIGLEPDIKIFELLRDNIYINSLEGVASARNAAASNMAGTLRLHRRLTRSGNTSITKVSDEALASIGEPPSEAFEIACMPIDSLLPEFDGRVDCLKIDVEGAEPLVFRGAHATIAGNPQIRIVMEWSPSQLNDAGFDAREFTAELAGLGLTAATIGTAGRAQPLSWDGLLALPYHPGILLTLAR